MGAIVSGFDNLPATADANALPAADKPVDQQTVDEKAAVAQEEQTRSQYALIYRSLANMKMPDGTATPLPKIAADKITADDLKAHLQQVAGAIIKVEVEGDVDLYADFSAGQTARVIRKLQQVGHIATLPYAPNALTDEDIAAALK